MSEYNVVTLCGSMRFYQWMLKVAEKETLDGNIVIMPFVQKDNYLSDEARENLSVFLDKMHKAKIDMADEIVICTDNAGYIGDSTLDEIQYSAKNLKPIRFAFDPSTPEKGADPDDYK